MEHLLFYSLIGLGVLAICLVLARVPGRARLTTKHEELAARARERQHRAVSGAAGHADQLARNKTVIQRELKQVPTPWGWPGSELRREASESTGLNGTGGRSNSGALKQWVDHLISEKRTVEDGEYRVHRQAALRAMVEDRFGRSNQATEVRYQKVKPPMLQDPERPYDQIDNFPSGRTDAIVSGLSRQPGGRPMAGNTRTPVGKTAALGSIRKPWGW